MEIVSSRVADGAASGALHASNSATAARGWVAIIEPNFDGHRWRYAEWIANACVEAGERCVIVTDRHYASHPLAQRIASNAADDLRIAPVELNAPKAGWFLNRSVYVRFHALFRAAYEAVSRDYPLRLVVVPYADYFFYTLGALGSPFGSTDWIGLVMGTTFHHSQIGIRTPPRPFVDQAKRLLFARSMHARGLRTLLTIDPTLPDWFARLRASRDAAPLEYVADPFPDTPAEDPQQARARLRLDPRERYLLVYGAISDRKGIRELVLALEDRQDAPTLVIAGEQDSGIRAFLDAHLPRLAHAPVVLDRFISEDDERTLFSACDAVWLGYRRHYGMSGVLVQAYRFGKPVIATADGLIGWFCRDGDLGPLLDDLTPASIADALDVLARRWNGDDKGALVHRADSLLARHTLDQFKHSFQRVVVATRA
jgi:glycosyltransferase involved in cell wall biosynthesis